MSHSLISILLKQTQQLTRKQLAVSDGELLLRYVSAKDQEGFADLVRRHGPMVWGVCRNALYLESDAEDAFQATFLTLVRSASKIRKHHSLGPWLHGVAVRICLKSRQAKARRLAREARVAWREGATVRAESWHDDIVQVHACIQKLPKREQAVFVLVVLEGMAQAEVARQLGLHVNSVSGLLARARQRLQKQLKSTEALSVLALTVAVSAHAAVPATLMTQTCGLAYSTSGIPISILALTTSITEVTMRKTITLAMLALFVGSGIPLGTKLLSSSEAQEPPPPFKQTQDTKRVVQGQPFSVNLHSGSVWEYKSIRRTMETYNDTELNALGEQGWELSSTATVEGYKEIVMIFKRCKQTVVKGVPLDPPVTDWINKTQSDDNKLQYAGYTLQLAGAAVVAENLKKMFGAAQIVYDPRTNSVHVQADAKLMVKIKAAITQMDGTDSSYKPNSKK